jgi:hypothetical protein
LFGFHLCCVLPLEYRVKGYHDQAVAAGIPALTTAGIYPGTSNVMAAHIVSISRGEYDEDWNYRDKPAGDCLAEEGGQGGVKMGGGGEGEGHR